jgi:hypothetical protein
VEKTVGRAPLASSPPRVERGKGAETVRVREVEELSRVVTVKSYQRHSFE